MTQNGNSLCSAGSTCLDLVDGFSCRCRPGFSGMAMKEVWILALEFAFKVFIICIHQITDFMGISYRYLSIFSVNIHVQCTYVFVNFFSHKYS